MNTVIELLDALRVVDRVLAVVKQKTISGARTAKIVISGIMRHAARHGAITTNRSGRSPASTAPRGASLGR